MLQKITLLLFTLFFTSFGSLFADESADGYSFFITNETAEIITYEGEATELNIPSTTKYERKTYSVTSIGEMAFADSHNLRYIIIPSSVTSIGARAFYKSSLTAIIIPNSVTHIGENAFYKSNKIELLVSKGSYALEYAEKNNIPYSFGQKVGEKYLTTDNLRLRQGEGVSGAFLFTVYKDTPLKVISLGSEQTIDGIIANWVEVEVAEDTIDIKGSEVKKGTVGWCFGGYLRPVPKSSLLIFWIIGGIVLLLGVIGTIFVVKKKSRI